MDDDDLRRGQPSCHKKFGEATAILVGDLLQSLSFELLANAQVSAQGVRYFARAVGAQGMVSGQFLDMEKNDGNTLRLHRLKTGKLIEAAIVLPFLQERKKIPLGIMRWARKLGLLFQITDDLLDVSSDSQTLGKTAGKDAAQHKKTIIALLGMEKSRALALQIREELTGNVEKIFLKSPLFAKLPEFLLTRRS
jgi:farnesyl diphosphate synthase